MRPWYIADNQFVVDSSKSLDSRRAVFVGGVPRPLRASELAEVMNAKYGNVVFVAIDCDSELKYPKGRGRRKLHLCKLWLQLVSVKCGWKVYFSQ